MGESDVGLLPCYVLFSYATPDGLQHSEAMRGAGKPQAEILEMRIRGTLCLSFREPSFPEVVVFEDRDVHLRQT